MSATNELTAAVGPTLTPEEAAAVLGVRIELVLQATVLGKLPTEYPLPDYRFPADVVLAVAANGGLGNAPIGRYPYPAPPPMPEWNEETAKECEEFLALLERLRRQDEAEVAAREGAA